MHCLVKLIRILKSVTFQAQSSVSAILVFLNFVLLSNSFIRTQLHSSSINGHSKMRIVLVFLTALLAVLSVKPALTYPAEIEGPAVNQHEAQQVQEENHKIMKRSSGYGSFVELPRRYFGSLVTDFAAMNPEKRNPYPFLERIYKNLLRIEFM